MSLSESYPKESLKYVNEKHTAAHLIKQLLAAAPHEK